MESIKQISSLFETAKTAKVNTGARPTSWHRQPSQQATHVTDAHPVDTVQLSAGRSQNVHTVADAVASRVNVPQARAQMTWQRGGGSAEIKSGSGRSNPLGASELTPASRWGRKYTSAATAKTAPAATAKTAPATTRPGRVSPQQTSYTGVQSEAELIAMTTAQARRTHGNYQTADSLLGRKPAAPATVEPAVAPAEAPRGTAGRILPVAGIVASAWQVKTGVDQIKQGNYAEGGANVAGGAANATACGAFLAGAPTVAMRAGGVGAGIDGLNDIYQGAKNHDAFRVGEGTAKTTAGALMASGSALAPHAATAYVAYSGTRAAMQVKVWGNQTGDKMMTDLLDGGMNVEQGQACDTLTQRNRGFYEITRNGQTDTRAVLGLQQRMEDCRNVGDTRGAQATEAALARLRQVQRSQTGGHAADYGKH